MNPEIDFVTLLGQAGTGKTLLTLAAGLMLTLEFKVYSEIIMTRVTVPVGEDIGFLPGTEEEKMNPWMGALEDNLDVLNKTDDEAGDWGRAATRDLIRSRIKVKSLNFMRGRTFINKFLIIDEAQNLTPKQMKTLITRAGPGHQGRLPRQHRADRHALPHRGQLGPHLRRRPVQGLVALGPRHAAARRALASRRPRGGSALTEAAALQSGSMHLPTRLGGPARTLAAGALILPLALLAVPAAHATPRWAIAKPLPEGKQSPLSAAPLQKAAAEAKELEERYPVHIERIDVEGVRAPYVRPGPPATAEQRFAERLNEGSPELVSGKSYDGYYYDGTLFWGSDPLSFAWKNLSHWLKH